MATSEKYDVAVRRLDESDVAEATKICRVAFGTAMGIPDPTQTFGDADPLANRWKANRDGVLGAYLGDRLVGSNVVSRWGSFGLFGPLTVLPEFWDKGIAKRLMSHTMETFSRWGTAQEGLFTFAGSPKHIGLYEHFGFSARFLTPVMNKHVVAPASASSASPPGKPFSTYSSLTNDKERNSVLNELREVTSEIYGGLDLSSEIAAVATLKLGDTLLVKERNGGDDNSRFAGFAICHAGAGTEAGSGKCFVKFAAVRPGASAAARFGDMLSALDVFASERGIATIEAGVNMGRREAYKQSLGRGFRTAFIGVAMHRPDEAGFNRPDVFALDDWR